MNSDITPFGNEPDESTYRRQLTLYLSAMCAALKTYGKNYSLPLLEGWMIVMRCRRISVQELALGTEHFLGRCEELPTPGAFANWCVESRERRENEALIQATYENEKRLNAKHRQALIDHGFDPDELVPTQGLAKELQVVEGTKRLEGSRKALPDSSEWNDPAQEARIAEQKRDLGKTGESVL